MRGIFERLTSRRMGPPWLAHVAVFIVIAAGVALIGWGQYAVSQAQKPFDWPCTAWLEKLFSHEYQKKNVLAFGVPLFVLGGLIFAAFAPRTVMPAIERWTGKIHLSRRRPLLLAAALIVPVTAWAWINYRLFTKHYDPVYRWVFFLSIAAVLVIFCALDWMQGRFGRPRFTRWHLVEVAGVAAITGTFIGINCRDLSNWRYSTIGDDNEFYVWAQRVLTGLHVNWFSQRGPYGEHPVLSSAWQALSMRVFGYGLFGWKMASLLTIALSLPFFYWLVRQLLGVRVAIFGTLFFGASHYMFAYAHTGYDNIVPILPTIACLALLVAGIKRSSFVLLFAAGIFAGMGFYTYYSSRAVIGIAAIVLVAVGWRRLRIDAFPKVAAGFVMFALPIFATDRWDVVTATLNRSTQRADYPFFKLVFENIPRTLLGFNFNPEDLHYTAGSLMDEVSVTLAVAGLFLALTRFHQFGYRTLMIWFLVAAAVAGVFSPYAVSISRLHYVLPPMAAFAGIAVDRLLASFGGIFRGPRPGWFAGAMTFAVLAPLVFYMNGRHFFVYSAKHSPTSTDTVILRELSDPRCRQQPLRSVLYHPQPETIVDFDWRFFGMSDNKPLQLRFSDISIVYTPYPATGGIGCVVLPNPYEPETRRVANILTAGYQSEQDYRIVTDLSGAQNRRVALVPASRDHRGLNVDDLREAWQTNIDKGEGLDRIVQGQEKAFVDTIDSPSFVPAKTPGEITEREPVVVVSEGKTAYAYPLRFLIWHHVVNGILNGQPIAVTYDPIAGTVQVFRRTVGGQTLSFGNSGLLRDGNALLYDRETESWWQQLTGAAVVGELAGSSLDTVPFAVSSWSEFRRAYPDGQILALSASSSGPRYGANPYLGYDVPKGKPIFTLAPSDPRLSPMRRVAVVEAGGERFAVAFPDDGAKENRVFTFEIDGQEVVLFFDRFVSSTLDTFWLRDSRAVGTFAAYATSYRAEPRTFTPTPEGFIDDQTSTVWNFLGRGVTGVEQGVQLEPVYSIEGFWFAISAAYPGIEIRQ